MIPQAICNFSNYYHHVSFEATRREYWELHSTLQTKGGASIKNVRTYVRIYPLNPRSNLSFSLLSAIQFV